MSDQVTLLPEIAAQNKGPGILAAIITVSVISTLFVAARLFVRIKIIGKLYLDDYFAMLSTICGWLAVAFACAAVSCGNGRHFGTLSPEQKSGAILWTTVGFVPGIMSFAAPKFAVAGLLTRILNPSRRHRIFLWSMTGLCCLSLIGCIIILFAQCTPSRSQWDFSVPGRCWSHMVLVNYSRFAGTFSAAADLYLALYPAVVLAKLQLSIKRKLALSGALGMGFIATIVAIYKCTRLMSLASPDFSYDMADLVIWTIVEGSTVTVASCIPILHPLVDVIFGKRALYDNSAQGRRYQKYGPDRSGVIKSSDVELSSSYRGARHKRGDNSSYMYGDAMRSLDAKDSQETILRQDQGGGGPEESDKTTTEAIHASPRNGGILRTDVFVLTYETGSQSQKTP